MLNVTNQCNHSSCTNNGYIRYTLELDSKSKVDTVVEIVNIVP